MAGGGAGKSNVRAPAEGIVLFFLKKCWPGSGKKTGNLGALDHILNLNRTGLTGNLCFAPYRHAVKLCFCGKI